MPDGPTYEDCGLVNPYTAKQLLDEQAAENERLRGEVLALHAVIHLAWEETSHGTESMTDDVRAAIERALESRVAHDIAAGKDSSGNEQSDT